MAGRFRALRPEFTIIHPASIFVKRNFAQISILFFPVIWLFCQ